jgi:hypothetical protein
MARGGKRVGAGRKRNSPNKATQERQAKIAAEGMTPLDLMIANMRWAYEQARNESDPAVALRLRTFAQSCASDAGPYVHPKLATLTHKGDADAPMHNTIEVCFVAPAASDDSSG